MGGNLRQARNTIVNYLVDAINDIIIHPHEDDCNDDNVPLYTCFGLLKYKRRRTVIFGIVNQSKCHHLRDDQDRVGRILHHLGGDSGSESRFIDHDKIRNYFIIKGHRIFAI